MFDIPQVNYIKCKNDTEEYRMSYTAWGNQEHSHTTLICVHGLNRNSRDYDYIGRHFAGLGYYVIAPDLVGRGNSDYLQYPMRYDIPTYIMDLLLLIKTLGLTNIAWLGTSLGGIVGMNIAAIMPGLLQKLILVDIGAEIESVGLARIAAYSSTRPDFETYESAKQYLIEVSSDFGDLPDEVWEYFTRNSVQKNMQSKYELKRDMNLMKPALNAASVKTDGDNLAPANTEPVGTDSVETESTKTPDSKTPIKENMQMWAEWTKILIPVLVIRGEQSDILSVDTVNKMKQTNTNMISVEIANAGHAPFLYNQSHFDLLSNFLNVQDARKS